MFQIWREQLKGNCALEQGTIIFILQPMFQRRLVWFLIFLVSLRVSYSYGEDGPRRQFGFVYSVKGVPRHLARLEVSIAARDLTRILQLEKIRCLWIMIQLIIRFGINPSQAELCMLQMPAIPFMLCFPSNPRYCSSCRRQNPMLSITPRW